MQSRMPCVVLLERYHIPLVEDLMQRCKWCIEHSTLQGLYTSNRIENAT